MACNLTLGGPEVTVHIEDAITEELVEDGTEPVAFDVVLKVESQEVIEIGLVGGADTVGEAEYAVNLDCKDGMGAGCGSEQFGHPIVEAVAVTDKTD